MAQDDDEEATDDPNLYKREVVCCFYLCTKVKILTKGYVRVIYRASLMLCNGRAMANLWTSKWKF